MPSEPIPFPGPRLLDAPAELPRTPVHARPPADLEVAIPAFNEAARLPRTLQESVDFLGRQPWSSRLVVVDNGSCDETAEVVRSVAAGSDHGVPIDLIGCSRPGKGAAVRRALLSSRSRFVGFFDADLATPVETIALAMAHLQTGAAAVIGSRHTDGSTVVQAQPAGRRLGGAVFRMAARNVVKGVRDTQCGFKFFERSAVTQALVLCRTTGFAFDVELLRHLQRNGHQVVELPVAWRHAGQSSFRPVQDGLASFGAVLQLQRCAVGRGVR